MTPYERAQYVHDTLLKRYGKTIPTDWLYGQMAHETADFSSDLAVNHYNYGGLTQETPNGLPQPDGNMYYKNFNSEQEGLDYYASYLHLYDEDGVFEAQTPEEYFARIGKGGWYTDDPVNYTKGAMRHIQGFKGVLTSVLGNDNSGVAGAPLVPANEPEDAMPEEPGFIDKFVFPIMEDNPLVKGARVGLVQTLHPSEEDYTFSNEDIELVNKTFNGDIASQRFIYANARSHTQLLELIEMQKEAKEMEQAIAASSYGFSTVGSVLGNIASELMNPLNMVGLGFVSKGRILKRVLKSAALTGALSIPDSMLRERTTGFEQNLVASAAISTAIGGLFGALGHFAEHGATSSIRKAASDGMERASVVEAQAEAFLDGNPLTRSQIFKRISNLGEKDYRTVNTKLQSLVDTNRAVVISKSKLKTLGTLLKTELPASTKALHVGDTTVFVKEAVEGMSGKQFDNLLLHEIGVHAMANESKAPLIDWINSKINRPKISKSFRTAYDKAIAAKPGVQVDPEEVLAYWVEGRTEGTSGGFLGELVDTFNKMMGRTDFTRKEVLDIIQRNTDDMLYGHNYGEADVVRLSTDTDVSPNRLVQLGIDDRPKANKASRILENSTLYGTTYGTLRNSKSPTARKLANKLLSDARIRDNGVLMTAEDYKNHVARQLAVPTRAFQEAKEKYLFEHFGAKAYSNKVQDKVDSQIVMVHDHLFAGNSLPSNFGEPSEEIVKLAKLLNAIRVRQRELGKSTGFIKNEGFGAFDDSMTRVIDNKKWFNFYKSFPGANGLQNAKEALKPYFYQAMMVKKSANWAFLQYRWDEAYKIAMEKYKEELAEWNLHPNDSPTPKPPKRYLVTEKDVHEYILKESQDLAEGYSDRSLSALYRPQTDPLSIFHHRAIFDTSYEMVINGKVFSFDKDLRSFDLETIVNHTNNRWAGEIAYAQAFPEYEITFDRLISGQVQVEGTLESIRAVIRKECEQRKAAGSMTQSEMNRTIEALDTAVRDLRGFDFTNPKNDGDTLPDYFSTVARGYTYAVRGGNMGINQLAEFGNMLSYVGARAVWSIIPRVWKGKDLIKSFYGRDKNFDKMQKDVVKIMGEDLRSLNNSRHRLLNSQRGREFGMMGSVLDVANNIVNVAGRMTARLSGLEDLAKRQMKDVWLFSYDDLCKFARGKDDFGAQRTFSDSKLKPLQIKSAAKFREDLQKFLLDDGTLDIDKMATENENLYFQCVKFIENQGKRCLVEPTIGNKNLLANSNPLMQILMQFKSFALSAVNGQAARKMTHHDLDDILAGVYDMFASMAMRMLTATLAAYAYYPNDEGKREKFIQDRKDMLWAVPFTSSTMAPIGVLMDAGESITGVSFRTTADTQRYKEAHTIGEFAANIINSSPAVGAVQNFTDAAEGIVKYGLTKENVLNTIKVGIPANNLYLFMYLINSYLEEMSIPSKNKEVPSIWED